ncbi:MAG: phosphoribosylformylglycinamidine synthase I [Candidatus Omnitrophica bacterium]|nr:phosphoribosylformylglycinamidine synthase I [Candidatus Omnitrophota bacterium]
MSNIKVLILRTAGTNCDQETRVAFELLKTRVKMVHVNDLIKGKDRLYNYQIAAIPGGFTYGDDIAAGRILANELKMKLKEELELFLKKNGLMIGICNGFQVLVKTGILPGNINWQQKVTLTCNDSGKFEDRWVYLKKPVTCNQLPVAGCRLPLNRCVWTKGIDEVIYLPVAHGEGKFIPQSKEILEKMKNEGQIVFEYCDSRGKIASYPDNPNGSAECVAGICDKTGRIFGLMPHPERCVFKTQHPRWTREKLNGIPDGLKIFKNAIEYLKKN